MLRVESITVGYGDLTVVNALSIHVEKSELIAFIGPNGAGKTTVLRAICGLEPLKAGKIFFNGKDLLGLPTYQIARRGLILVPSNARVFPKFSIKDNLLMGTIASEDKKTPFSERIQEIYDLFPRLAERTDQKAETLSGGERQMLAMGRALMSKPRLLIMDEPTAGLSPKLAEEVFGHIGNMRKMGLTVLIVEEKIEHVLRMSDRAYAIQNGRIVVEGSPNELLASSEILKAYLGVKV